VVAQAVGFDDEAELGPVEVHLEAVQAAPRLRLREPGPAGQWEEAALELGVGQGECATVQRSPQGRCAGSGGDDIIEGGPERLGIRQVALVGFVDSGFELGPVQPRGNIDERADRGGDGDGMVVRQVVCGECRPAVDHDAGMSSTGTGGDETSISRSFGDRISQSAAAVSWLSAASGPQHRTAAIQRPYMVSCGRPTAYTPRLTR
jgi:hypothetical protein